MNVSKAKKGQKRPKRPKGQNTLFSTFSLPGKEKKFSLPGKGKKFSLPGKGKNFSLPGKGKFFFFPAFCTKKNVLAFLAFFWPFLAFVALETFTRRVNYL